MRLQNTYIQCSILLLGALYGHFLVGCSKNPTGGEKREQVIVSGDITEDTVWESGKDYIVEGEVVVGENATLIIEESALIEFKEKNGMFGRILINGGLVAQGQRHKPITFDGNERSTIEIVDGIKEVKLEYCNFNTMLTAIKTFGRIISLKSLAFNQCYVGVHFIAVGSGCQIMTLSFNQCDTGVRLEQTGNTNIETIEIKCNEFYSSSNAGVEVVNKSCCTIYDNLFSRCGKGVSVKYSSVVNINYNDFVDNNTGCYFFKSANGTVVRNVFLNASESIYLSHYSYPVINFNNFEYSKAYAIKMGIRVFNVIDASNNWWGSVKLETINQLLYDKNDTNEEDMSVIQFQPIYYERLTQCGRIAQ